MTTVGRNKPPPSLSVHAQCFWVFTPTERRIMKVSLQYYMQGMIDQQSKSYLTAQMLRDALDELSTQD